MKEKSELWEEYVRQRFVGYLLPASAKEAISFEEAKLLLGRLRGIDKDRELLIEMSMLVAAGERLPEFIHKSLAHLIANLPRTSKTYRRNWHGGFKGRLNLPGTLNLHMNGQSTAFITQVKKPSFDLPENLLIRYVCDQLLRIFISLQERKLIVDGKYGEELKLCLLKLQYYVTKTSLKYVKIQPINIGHENAAKCSRHAAYLEAASWAEDLRKVFAEKDPFHIAQVVSKGALTSCRDSTRFEIAVLLRFVEALEKQLRGNYAGRWRKEQTLIVAGRSEIFSFISDDETVIQIFFNQSVLAGGIVDKGRNYYFNTNSVLRPDITIRIVKQGMPVASVVIECKMSEDKNYLIAGYHKASLYCFEYRKYLTLWPCAVLVASSDIPVAMSDSHDVVACGWKQWPPEEIVASICDAATT
jgi:hypothetical protein